MLQCSQLLFLPYSITYALTTEKASDNRVGNLSWQSKFFHKCLGPSGGPCCAQNTIKTAKAFTSVWVLKRPACALHLHTRPAGAKQLISVPKTVPIHHLCLWQRCDKTANREYTSTCTQPCFQTFRLSLRGTGRDKKLETIFAFFVFQPPALQMAVHATCRARLELWNVHLETSLSSILCRHRGHAYHPYEKKLQIPPSALRTTSGFLATRTFFLGRVVAC